MVCTGVRSEREAKSAVGRVVRDLRKQGFIIPRRPEIDIVWKVTKNWRNG